MEGEVGGEAGVGRRGRSRERGRRREGRWEEGGEVRWRKEGGEGGKVVHGGGRGG